MWNLKPPPKDICQYNNLKNILFSHSPTKGQNMIKVIGTPDIPPPFMWCLSLLYSRGVYLDFLPGWPDVSQVDWLTLRVGTWLQKEKLIIK